MKNEYPGGKLSAFEKDGYLFDAGPSLIYAALFSGGIISTGQ
jgi:phytoene dehydrogenase-like protein